MRTVLFCLCLMCCALLPHPKALGAEPIGEVTKGLSKQATRRSPDVTVAILIDGRPLATVQEHRKTYVVVPRLGVEYEILLTNNGTRRVACIVSVDGLGVMNGQVADEKSSGYVLSPNSSYRIKGWRRGNEKVAAFNFTKPEASYAALTGRSEGIGTIRLIAIEERPPLRTPRRPSRSKGSFLNGSSSARALPANAGGVRTGNGPAAGAGTGYGRALDDRVRSVEFRRSRNVQRVILYYATTDEVQARKGKEVLRSENFTPAPAGYTPN